MLVFVVLNLYPYNGFILEGVRKMAMKITGENKDEFFMTKYYE